MPLLRRLHAMPLRGKLAVTFLGVVALALTASTVLTFRYWQSEFLEASEQQASLAATSTRAALESMLSGGSVEAGRRSLARVVGGAPVSAARVYAADGTVLVSSDAAEEGIRTRGVWIPASESLPRDGVLKQTPRGDTVRVYMPLSLRGGGGAVLELVLPVAGVKAAMERGALMGTGLMLLSFVALGVIVVTMLEREVISPLHRMQDELGEEPGAAPPHRRDEMGRLAASVTRLVEREREAAERAARRDQELAERQGFAQVGELAAEMAHEFKRPLASIRTAMELLEQEYALDEGGQRVLGQVDHQLERLTETMHDLFSLAKPVAMEVEAVELEEVLDDALMELRALPSSSGIQIRRQYGADVPPVRGDAHRLEQAFLNLVTNAAEAMDGGGTLEVSLDTAPDERAVVTVRDTGHGITPGEVERAMRPFYSTKPLGTGLGLPLVARVVSAHGGTLDIASTPGEGTTVTVVLPIRSRAGTGHSAPLHPGSEADAWHPNASSSSTTTS